MQTVSPNILRWRQNIKAKRWKNNTESFLASLHYNRAVILRVLVWWFDIMQKLFESFAKSKLFLSPHGLSCDRVVIVWIQNYETEITLSITTAILRFCKLFLKFVLIWRAHGTSRSQIVFIYTFKFVFRASLCFCFYTRLHQFVVNMSHASRFAHWHTFQIDSRRYFSFFRTMTFLFEVSKKEILHFWFQHWLVLTWGVSSKVLCFIVQPNHAWSFNSILNLFSIENNPICTQYMWLLVNACVANDLYVTTTIVVQ